MVSWSDCNMWQKVDYIWSLANTNSVFGLGRSSKVLPKAKPKLAPKMVMITVWWSAAYQIHYSFVNCCVWEVCLANRWDANVNHSFQQNGPNSPQHTTASHTTNTSKVKPTGLWSVTSSTIFTWPPATLLPFLQASQQFSAGKILPQPAGGRKCFPRVCQIVKQGLLLYRNKQTYFLLTKMS